MASSPLNPQTLRTLRLLTEGIGGSAAFQMARHQTTLQKLAAIQDSPAMKLARDETTMQRLAAVNDSPVMRAARGDATWQRLTRGEPTLLAALRQSSLAVRLNQVFAELDAARIDQALLLARATYEDALQTVAIGALPTEAPPGYEQLLEDAEQMVANAFEQAGLDGEAELAETKAAAQADAVEAAAAGPQEARDVVAVEPSELPDTNELLRALLSRAPEPPAPDNFLRVLTVALLIVAILQIFLLQPSDAPTTTPAPRSAPVTHIEPPSTSTERAAPTPSPPSTESGAPSHPGEHTPPGPHRHEPRP